MIIGLSHHITSQGRRGEKRLRRSCFEGSASIYVPHSHRLHPSVHPSMYRWEGGEGGHTKPNHPHNNNIATTTATATQTYPSPVLQFRFKGRMYIYMYLQQQHRPILSPESLQLQPNGVHICMYYYTHVSYSIRMMRTSSRQTWSGSLWSKRLDPLTP